LIGDTFHCEYAAEGLVFGNSVYWIRFDEEFSEKVELLLLATTWSLIFHFLLMFFYQMILEDDTFLFNYWSLLLSSNLTRTSLVQKFKSSSPFGIKYKFHLEVPLIIQLLYHVYCQ
jgi:hypothetical protein